MQNRHRISRFQVTIRDWFWLTLVIAIGLGFVAERKFHPDAYVQLLNYKKRQQARHRAELGALQNRIGMLEQGYVTLEQNASTREQDLKTTIAALKLRLGEDPRGK